MTDATTPTPTGDDPARDDAGRRFVYDAFISYSQRGDRAVAKALRSVVQSIGTPWWKARGLNVFLDATSLSAAPSLWQGIEEKLAVSRYLILLASPEAAASKWVDREVAYFIERNGKERLLIALTEGELNWDETLGDFRSEGGLPLPPALHGRFAEEPLWVDLRAFRRDPATATKGNQAFLHAALDLAATIRGVEKADLYSDEITRQRRMLRLAYGTAGVVALLAIGAGIAAFIAIENEARAVRNFEIARQTVDSVVFDVSQGLREVEGMRTDTVRTILGSVEEAVSRLSDAAADDTDILRSRGAMLDEFGDTYAATGDRASALAAYQQSLDIARRLAAADPDSTLYQRDVAVALSAIGDIHLARGDTAAAIESFEGYLDIARKLTAIDPANTEWLRDVALALGRIGRARLEAGDPDAAMAAQAESLDIHRRLADGDPEDTLFQRDLAVRLENISGIDEVRGDFESAYGKLAESIAITRRLNELDPDNTLRTRDLSLRLIRMSNIELRRGNADAAVAALEESITVARRLVGLDPESADPRHDLAVALQSLGDIRLNGGDVDAALPLYRESLDIFGELAGRDPDSPDGQLNVAILHQRLGDAERVAGRPEAAIAAYRDSNAVFGPLAAADPSRTTMRLDLAINFSLIGDLAQASDPSAAAEAYGEALAIRRALTDEQPDDAGRQAELAGALEKVGMLQAMAGNGDAAVATMAEIIAARRRVAEIAPDDLGARQQLGNDLERFGNLQMVIGNPPAALAAWQDNLAVRQALAEALPDDPDIRRKLAGAYANVAFAELFAGDFAGSEAASRKAMELAPGETVFTTNLAHALMLEGRLEDADALYLGNRGIDLGGRRWEDVIRADFDALRRQGVEHPHMAEIERLYDTTAEAR